MAKRWTVQASGLRRTFQAGRQTIEAVRGVSFAVAEGELLALLGPNGAGKSTTLRMLTTLLAPTAGTAQVAGIDVAAAPRQARTVLGYVGQHHAAGANQRVRDELLTQARCYGITGRAARVRAEQTLESFGIGELALRLPGTLSGGQRRRVDLALGMVHRPRVLFLDEPSSGLDPRSRAGLWQQVTRLRREQGVTVVLSTHYLDEADQLAERIVIVDRGRVVADGTAAELKAGSTAAAANPDKPTLDEVFISLTGRAVEPTGEAYPTDEAGEPERSTA